MRIQSKNIIKGTVFMLLGTIIKTILLFVNKIVISKFFGASILGSYAIANTIFQTLLLVSLLGFHKTINRFAPEYIEDKKKTRLLRLIGTSLKTTFIVSIFLIIFIYMLLNPIVSSFNDQHLRNLLMYLLIGLPFFVVTRILLSIATSFQTTKLQAFIDSVLIPFLSTFFIFISVLLDLDYKSIAISFLITYFISFLVTILATKFSQLKTLNILRSLHLYNNKYLKYTIPIFLGDIFFFLINWIDTLFLGYFSVSENVGVYNASITIITIPRLLLISLNTIFLPSISSLIALGRKSVAFNLFKDSIRLLLFITIPLLTIIIVNFKTLLSIFGSEFDIQMIIILVLCIGTIINVATGPIDHVLNSLDKTKLVTINSLIALSSSLILNILLVPRLNILGAALANSFALSIQNILGIFELFIIEKTLPYNLKTFIYILVSIFIFIVLLIANTIFNLEYNSLLDKFLYTSIFGIITFLIHISIIFIFRLYTSQDKNLLKHILFILKK